MSYLDDLYTQVRNAHDRTNQTCHWTEKDKKDANEEGPCHCPKDKPNKCSEHSCFGCSDTATVLNAASGTEKSRSGDLTNLQKHVDNLNEAIRSGEEAVSDDAKARKKADPSLSDSDAYAQALAADKGDIVKTILAGHEQVVQVAVDFILKLAFTDVLDTAKATGFDCQCLKNKQKRLDDKKTEIDDMNKLAKEETDTLQQEWKKLDPRSVHITDVISLLSTAAKIALAVSAIELGPIGFIIVAVPGAIVHGVDLGEYIEKKLKGGMSYGGELLVFYETMVWLALLKANIILLAIYRDKERLSPSCQPKAVTAAVHLSVPHSETKEPVKKPITGGSKTGE